jgi:dCTP deaminase
MWRAICNRIDDALSPILSDRVIRKYNTKGLLIEQELTEAQIQPNSIDLTLGNTWKTIVPNIKLFAGSAIDPRQEIQFEHGRFEVGRISDADVNGGKLRMGDDPIVYEECERFILKPHKFVLMATNEIFNIPNGIASIVCGRSSIARLAIQTEQAGWVDAGFYGTITLEVYNQSDYPIILYPGMRVAQAIFIKAQKAAEIYGSSKGSKYNQQISATASRIHLDAEFRRSK